MFWSIVDENVVFGEYFKKYANCEDDSKSKNEEKKGLFATMTTFILSGG